MATNTNRGKNARVWFVVSWMFISVCLEACSPSRGHKLTPTELQGKQAFTAACMRCHEPFDLQTAEDGPSLRGMFEKATLPSGAPATDQQVSEVIIHGRGKMRPVLGEKLAADDVGPLIAYLHTH